MNHLGSRQRRDTDQGPFSLLTGGQGFYLMTDYLKFKKKIRTDTGPVLLRQGEPGTPQYIIYMYRIRKFNKVGNSLNLGQGKV